MNPEYKKVEENGKFYLTKGKISVILYPIPVGGIKGGCNDKR
jgi:hypothetical protein